MTEFALIGVGGYIAPRHMEAMRATGGQLVAALDRNDSVGVIDRYFPDAAFFTEPERFDRHLEKLRRAGRPVGYLSVCSPNYLHDAHVRFGIRQGMDVICEKPVVLHPANLGLLQTLEAETGQTVYPVLQMRFHPAIRALRDEVLRAPKNKIFDIDLTYITARGRWYYASWKGDTEKSGGIATNIGIHFFDLLCWIFGPVLESQVHQHLHDRAAGRLRLERANVRWFLSINADTLPDALRGSGATAQRAMTVDGRNVNFTETSDNLISAAYRSIFEGGAVRLADAVPAIDLAYRIRNTKPETGSDQHPLASLAPAPHPFAAPGGDPN